MLTTRPPPRPIYSHFLLFFKGEPEPETSDDSEHKDHQPVIPEEGEPEPELKGEGVTSFTPKGEFHAMDCVDMVIGMARGDASRILDYYTRDRF